jgi:hypothetical protein
MAVRAVRLDLRLIFQEGPLIFFSWVSRKRAEMTTAVLADARLPQYQFFAIGAA